jgi:large subunit ribosomal protein L9
MKVILLHEVPGLGQPGDVKDVANGYARNYLLPRQLVTAATVSELARLRERVDAAQAQAARQRATNESLAEKLGKAVLTFAVRVGRGDRLYGSVTSIDIANALHELEGLSIDRRLIHLKEPLRQLGEFQVPVRVTQGVEPKITVRIIARGTEHMQGAAQEATTVPSAEIAEEQSPTAKEE